MYVNAINISVVEKLEGLGYNRCWLYLDLLINYGLWDSPEGNLVMVDYGNKFQEKLFLEDDIMKLEHPEDLDCIEIDWGTDLKGYSAIYNI